MIARLRFCRRSLMGIFAAVLLLATAGSAHAQFSNYVYYRNPRTGQAYSVGGTYGNGYRSYQGGFSYSAPGRYYSNYSGWGGGPGNRHYWGGSQYGAPNYGYGQRWGW